jgi:N-methylhydantoinase B
VIAEPIFVDNRLVAWTVNLAHHADFVDRGHAHIYQEGLRIPPVRLYRGGELQKDVQDLILLNCQVPKERLSDLRAQMAANRAGVLRFQALCAKYGTETVLSAGEALMDYAERKMRAAIAAIPDGSWRFEDVFDNEEVPEPLPLGVEVTVKGDSLRSPSTGPSSGAPAST